MGVTWSSMRAGTTAQSSAQKTVASAFLIRTGAAIANVRTCSQVSAGEASGIFRCSVAAPNCSRSFLFKVSKSTNRVVPYDQPRSIFLSPCDFASDPAGDLS
jgi:hypothetical protein